MSRTYSVKWREPDGQTYLGCLSLAATALGLEGRGQDGRPVVSRLISYDEMLISTRSRDDRLDGQPALVVERADGRYLITSAGVGAGVVQELIDCIAGLRRAAQGHSNHDRSAANPQ